MLATLLFDYRPLEWSAPSHLRLSFHKSSRMMPQLLRNWWPMSAGLPQLKTFFGLEEAGLHSCCYSQSPSSWIHRKSLQLFRPLSFGSIRQSSLLDLVLYALQRNCTLAGSSVLLSVAPKWVFVSELGRYFLTHKTILIRSNPLAILIGDHHASCLQWPQAQMADFLR